MLHLLTDRLQSVHAAVQGGPTIIQGRATMTIAAILRHKGSEVAQVAPGAPVSEVVHMLSERHIGAVLVMDGPTLVGILSERDVVRCLASHGASALDHTAETLMTRNPRTAGRDMTCIEALGIMTENRFRHLPIVEDGRVAGIVSIGDVVKRRLDQQAQEVDELKAYVAGQ